MCCVCGVFGYILHVVYTWLVYSVYMCIPVYVQCAMVMKSLLYVDTYGLCLVRGISACSVCVFVCVSVHTHLCIEFVKGLLYVEDWPWQMESMRVMYTHVGVSQQAGN